MRCAVPPDEAIQRAALLEVYCSAILYDHRSLRRATGIAIDAAKEVTGRIGGSEDILTVEIGNWTPELESSVQERRRALDVLTPERTRHKSGVTRDYPNGEVKTLTRQQRRAAERAAKKRGR